jgi:hypothetical protein
VQALLELAFARLLMKEWLTVVTPDGAPGDVSGVLVLECRHFVEVSSQVQLHRCQPSRMSAAEVHITYVLLAVIILKGLITFPG